VNWEKMRATWPHAEASRFVTLRPHRWHVQVLGAANGPDIVLLHGTGASAHSWRDVAAILATKARVIVPDLPGHGFTRLGTRTRSGLDEMAADLGSLIADQGWAPHLIAGHSAGAALALRLAGLLEAPPAGILGVNAALGNFRGMAGWLFPAMARALALNPFAAPLFARGGASEALVERVIGATGSTLDAQGRALYRALLSDRDHIDGTLAMMARWRLDGLLADLPAIGLPALLLTGSADRAVPPATSEEAARLMPRARHEDWPGHGHLLHEEDPTRTAGRIAAFLEAC